MGSLLRPLLVITSSLVVLALLVLTQASVLVEYFRENLVINTIILLVLIFGIGLSYWRLFNLAYEIDWLGRIKTANQTSNPETLAGPSIVRRLDLMAAFATVWRRFFDSNQVLTPALSANLVDSAQGRVDERRELSRYIINALVILGLLGTFWGLLGTLVSIRGTLTAFESSGGLGQDFLTQFSQGLQQPLDNMGTAFSSSLFGLAASLFFGLVELQTARAQNNFVEDFETWLASLVQAGAALTAGASPLKKPQANTTTVSGELDGHLEGLQSLMRRGQQDTMVLNNNLVTLLDQVSKVADKLNTDQAVHEKIIASQADLSTLIQKLDVLATTPDSQADMIAAVNNQTAELSAQLAASAQAHRLLVEDLGKNRESTDPAMTTEPDAPAPAPAAGAFVQSKDPS